jgi:DnaJ-class molecular chaperone
MKWTNIDTDAPRGLERLRAMSPHELLGVSATASKTEIRQAYFELARVYHPDKAGDFMRSHNEEVMKLINAAYERLTAPPEQESA